MKKLMLLAAGAVGYVLGAKAGRERYEQLRAGFDKVRNDPRVQERTQQTVDAAKDAAGQATDKMKGSGSGSHSDEPPPTYPNYP